MDNARVTPAFAGGEPPASTGPDAAECELSFPALVEQCQWEIQAYLLYHRGLKPREIVRFCPREWNDAQEIYRLRRNILERLLRSADQLRWLLDHGKRGEQCCP